MQSLTMPGVGQTSVHIQTETPAASPAPQSAIKSVHTDDLAAKPSTSSAADADDDDEDDDAPMTREEMLKAAKQKKKNAKLNSNFKKKMRDSGF